MCSGARNTEFPITSRAWAVCSGVVRYGCAPALRCADSLSTLGPSAATTLRLVGTHCFIEHVQVLHQYVVGLAVLVGVFGMADADAEQEPAWVGVLDAVIRLGDLFGRAPSRR